MQRLPGSSRRPGAPPQVDGIISEALGVDPDAWVLDKMKGGKCGAVAGQPPSVRWPSGAQPPADEGASVLPAHPRCSPQACPPAPPPAEPFPPTVFVSMEKDAEQKAKIQADWALLRQRGVPAAIIKARACGPPRRQPRVKDAPLLGC